jgi:raffinose/stachyose/melibiose transport system substrate-binding protein
MICRQAPPRRRAKIWRAKVRRPMAAVVGAALACLLAAGCSSGPAGGSNSGSGSTTLVVWSFQGESSSPSAGVPYAFYLIDRAFEKAHPNIKVQMVLQPFANYRPLFAAAAQSRSGPDVWEALPGSYVFQYKAALQPLNRYVTSAFKNTLRGWSGAIVPEWSNTGTIYGIPSELQSYVWYYNKALFARAGIAEPPATWSELLADAGKLKAAGITPMANGIKDGFGIDQYLNPMLSVMLPPSRMLGLGDGSLSWTSAVPEQAATMYKDLAPYFESGYQGIDFEGPGIDLFSGGKAAIIPGLISNNANYFQFEAALGKKDLGVFRTPAITAAYSKQMTFTSDYMWTITKWAPDTQAAVEYAKFMVSPQAQRILLTDGGDIPNLTSVPDSEFSADANAAQIWSMLSSSTLTNQPNANFSDALETAWHQQFQDVMSGSESVGQASQNLQEAATSGGQ